MASHNSLQERFQALNGVLGKRKKKQGTGKILFHWDKWKMFHGHMGFDDLDVYMETICQGWKRLVSLPTVLSLDEQTPGYHPSSETKIKNKEFGWDIPLLHIETKPHRHCFWLSTLTTKLKHSNAPFILYIVPFFKQPQLSPNQVCKRVVDYLEGEDTKLIIMDRLYDSEDVRKTIESGKHLFLISAKSGSHSGIDKVLGESLPVKQWRVVHGVQDRIYSVENILKKNKKVDTVFCVSNGFTYNKMGKLRFVFILRCRGSR